MPPRAGSSPSVRTPGAGRQSGLFEAFHRGASANARRRSLAEDAPLEVAAYPPVYDAFTVQFLETEGTERGFRASERERDLRRSGASTRAPSPRRQKRRARRV
jgi:hypothetical protein